MDYIILNIVNQEPLKIGDSNSSDAASYSKEYIAGGSIRGAVIGALINDGFDMDDLSKKSDLLSHVKFTNAYLSSDGKRMLPMPLGFLAEKKVLAAYKGEDINICSIYDDNITGLKPVKKEGFVKAENTTLEGISARKAFNLHIGVNGRSTAETERTMFRYEALAEGQSFISYILFEETSDDVREAITKLLEKEKIFYIGGSKGSGYGRCEIGYTSIKAASNPEATAPFTYDGGKELYIYFAADAILQNIYGESAGFIDRETFTRMTGIDVDIEYAGGAVDNTMISGYNNKYGGTLPAYCGIKAGSIQKYIIKGETDSRLREALMRLEEKGIGLRTEEGFGRILFSGRPVFSTLRRVKADSVVSNSALSSDEEKKQLDIIGKRLFVSMSRNDMETAIVNEKRRFTRIAVEKSQLGGIIDLLRRGYNIRPNELKKEFEEHFNHMQEKKGNPRAFRQFIDTKIDNRSLNEYILNLVWHIDEKLLFASETANKVANKSLIANISKEDNYRLNLDYLIKLMKYLRKGDR